jgi:predicted transcriptional regulator
MATSIHVPSTLLDAIDRKARALRVSRNQLIVRALERELQAGGDWSSGFIERLAETDAELSKDVNDLLATVRAARRSKPARSL